MKVPEGKVEDPIFFAYCRDRLLFTGDEIDPDDFAKWLNEKAKIFYEKKKKKQGVPPSGEELISFKFWIKAGWKNERR